MCSTELQNIKELHPARWVKRTEMEEYRGITRTDCRYSCVLNAGFGKETLARLSALAPEIDGASLSEVVVNRYESGDYIPAHVDLSSNIYNILIHLEDSDKNGIVIEDKFYPDKAGQMVIFNGSGVVHEVLPVTGTRYTLIYLYERAL